MDWKTLKKIADAGSISTKVDEGHGIVGVRFTINGSEIQAQFSTQTAGIFAFSIWNGAGLLNLLDLDENGDPIEVTYATAGDENDKENS